MIGTREEWIAARRELLDKEKELTHRTPRGRPAREELGDWPRRHDEYEEAVHAG